MKSMMNTDIKYRKVLLKLSGESLGGESGTGLSPNMMKQYASEIAQVAACNVNIHIGKFQKSVQNADEIICKLYFIEQNVI